MGNHNILDAKANDITAEDSWQALYTAELPDGIATTTIHLGELLHKPERLDVILPMSDVLSPQGLLTEALDLISNHVSRVGLWADTEISTEQLDALLAATEDKEHNLLNALDLIVFYQPKFADGRTFSQIRHLRHKGFKGELRIAGHFGRDQIVYLQRAGVDTFVINAGDLTEDIKVSFGALASSYDGSVARQLPMFR
ncbi:DUF934 domain-containing protein [Psychrobacter sp. FDAARGOS_221]|uniref:DUF934 domain-containing protein n=1 Tax=Psychrobacter sp. FDAARGOS_221 TaxID=1975705 RepID=UPI000BB5918C|nr:DUF934 domain-containing protein [Psychrobacter sp. FDAARGOS_221]PNK59578.1 DUF934 domain-containing protein [Psychrobacter sp. FDAARGOS_221]